MQVGPKGSEFGCKHKHTACNRNARLVNQRTKMKQLGPEDNHFLAAMHEHTACDNNAC